MLDRYIGVRLSVGYMFCQVLHVKETGMFLVVTFRDLQLKRYWSLSLSHTQTSITVPGVCLLGAASLVVIVIVIISAIYDNITKF